jgi:NADPH-dependent F420 reductase
MKVDLPNTIAILGGTGAMGLGLGARWARKGRSVILGSRDSERARAAAEALGRDCPGASVVGTTNTEAAARAELAVLTVPFAHQESTLASVRQELAGKILVAATVPLRPPHVDVVALPAGGSAAGLAQASLGEHVRVVSAFQNVSAKHLAEGHTLDCDILVTGDDPTACEIVVRLAEEAGMRAFRAGPLANAVVAESLTAVLLHINRTYKIAGAGVRITGEQKGGGARLPPVP